MRNGITKEEIPSVGFGTCEIYDKEIIKEAISNGYRLIDTAAHYFNEEVIGQAIKEIEVPRSEIIVQSKLWYSDMGYDNALFAFEESLKKLQMDVLDIYLIHWPAANPKYPEWEKTNFDTWRALERLYEEKRVKAIGVCNFMERHIQSLIQECKVVPMLNQIEVHPGFYQKSVIEYCQGQNIAIEAWGPLGEGEVLNNEILVDIAKEYNKSTAQICIKWLLQHGINPIVKSSNTERMIKNRDVLGFEISKEHMICIDQLPFCGGAGAIVK